MPEGQEVPPEDLTPQDPNRPLFDRVLLLVQDGIKPSLHNIWKRLWGENYTQHVNDLWNAENPYTDGDVLWMLRGIEKTWRKLAKQGIDNRVRNLAFGIIQARNDFAHQQKLTDNQALKLIADAVELLRLFGAHEQVHKLEEIKRDFFNNQSTEPQSRVQDQKPTPENRADNEDARQSAEEEQRNDPKKRNLQKALLVSLLSSILVLGFGLLTWALFEEEDWYPGEPDLVIPDQATVVDFVTGDEFLVGWNNGWLQAANFTDLADSVTTRPESYRDFRYISAIKLIGIAAPQVGDCGFEQSLEFLRSLIPNDTVVDLERDITDRDYNYRYFRYVWLDGLLINEVMVREGWARSSRVPPDTKYQSILDQAERLAIQEGRGLWSLCDFPTTSTTTTTSTLRPDPDPVRVPAWITRLVKGDTIEVEFEDGTTDTVRLIGIEAPHQGQCYHQESIDLLEAWTGGVGAMVNLTKDVSERDPFDRLLRYVWNDVFVNAEMVRSGGAYVNPVPPDTFWAPEIEMAEDEARREQLGIWDPSICPSPDSSSSSTTTTTSSITTSTTSSTTTTTTSTTSTTTTTFPSTTTSSTTTTTSTTTTSTTTTTVPQIRGEPAIVISIVDGDDIVVELADGSIETVRLIGINAPEMQTRECYSQEATDLLERLAPPGSGVGLEPDVTNRDRYGRLLRYVSREGIFINQEMVLRGAALSRIYEPDDEYAAELDRAQEQAEREQRGLWDPEACGGRSEANIVIDYLNYNPPGNEALNPNDEWIRLKNEGSGSTDMTGWSLADESASNRFRFPDGFSLAPGQTVMVHSGCGTDTQQSLYWCSDFPVWNNDGDTAFLRDANGNIHDSYSY